MRLLDIQKEVVLFEVWLWVALMFASSSLGLRCTTVREEISVIVLSSLRVIVGIKSPDLCESPLTTPDARQMWAGIQTQSLPDQLVESIFPAKILFWIKSWGHNQTNLFCGTLYETTGHDSLKKVNVMKDKHEGYSKMQKQRLWTGENNYMGCDWDDWSSLNVD